MVPFIPILTQFRATFQVTFNGNLVTQYGAAIYSSNNSHVTFTGSSNVKFENNNSFSSKHLRVGGNIFSKSYGHVSFDEDSVTKFINNSANFGAVIFSLNMSRVSFKGKSKVMFSKNSAQYCGISTSALYSSVYFNNSAKVIYNSNSVSVILSSNNNNFESSEPAGTICTFIGANVIFSGYSHTIFINNKAMIGAAAIFSESNVIIEEHAEVIINNNIAEYLYGGRLYV